ncbi:MAG: NADP-dependent malic enzyme [Clostridiales bacterium]|nr:NADP-dependent malic enzyme [Clostridiales bacterium]
MDYSLKSLKLCEENRGKLRVESAVQIDTREQLSAAYTPGVAEPCRRIHQNPEDIYKYTIKGHTIAVVTDGTAVLGLGDIGPGAGLPVMEGKCALFKRFAGVDAFPICLDTKDPDEIVRTVKLIAPAFGGINLEDISAPRCFEIERRLRKELDIPVFHDDQHGTAIVVCAGLMNALKLTGRTWKDTRVVISGAGSAGLAICRLMLSFAPGDIILSDKMGLVCEGKTWLNPEQAELSVLTNRGKLKGTLKDAIKGADVFIGVSAPNLLTSDNIRQMNPNAIVFALANPTPEIMPEEAKKGGAAVIATGRSDYPNQINNVLAFPGIFKGALEARAKDITEEMKLAASRAIAALVSESELCAEKIMPDPFDPRVAEEVARTVREAAER